MAIDGAGRRSRRPECTDGGGGGGDAPGNRARKLSRHVVVCRYDLWLQQGRQKCAGRPVVS